MCPAARTRGVWSWALGGWGELSPKGGERPCQAGRLPDWRWGWGRSLQEAQGQVPGGILWQPQHPLRAPHTTWSENRF